VIAVPAGDVIENPAARMTLRLVRTAAETNGELLEMEATYEPGSVEPLEHYHPRQDERFDVLAGTIEATVGGERQTLTAGDTLDVPAGTVHAMWNGGDDAARVNWQTRPALRTEDFFRVAGRLAQEGKLTPKGPSNPLLGAAVMQEFRDESRPASPPAPIQAVAFPVLATLGRALGRGPQRAVCAITHSVFTRSRTAGVPSMAWSHSTRKRARRPRMPAASPQRRTPG
jgi:quercetin dioxygenase-like cupin family protein